MATANKIINFTNSKLENYYKNAKIDFNINGSAITTIEGGLITIECTEDGFTSFWSTAFYLEYAENNLDYFFNIWSEGHLTNTNKMKTGKQRQCEQVTDKFQSLIAEMEETLKLIPLKGNNPDSCKRTYISNQLRGLDHCINGIELEDFTPNEYSGNFKLSYS